MDLSEIISSFQRHNLLLRPNACNFLKANYLTNKTLSTTQKREKINKILNRLTNLDGADSDIKIDDSGVVTLENLELALKELDGQHRVKENNPFIVVDIFKDKENVKKFVYSQEKQDMLEIGQDGSGKSETAVSSSESLIRTSMFLNRFHHIKSRLKRLKHDSEIVSIEAVQSSTLPEKICILFGLIVKIDQEHYELEDNTGKIQLDFSGCDFIKGCYFIENCFYVVKGFQEISSDSFKVTQLALPPIETTAALRSVIGNKNLFGTPGKKCASSNINLKKIEKDPQNQEIFFLFLNEVWLDSPTCLKNFDKVLQGFISSEMLPAAIIMTGNFSSKKYINELTAVQNYVQMFTSFAKKINENFPEVVNNCRFIFVPGSKDPGAMSNFLPRPAIYTSITDKVKRYFQNSKSKFYFTSNPCRIQYCTQEIIICKLDIGRMLETVSLENAANSTCSSNTGKPARSQKEKINDLSMTVNSQSHLCPLPLDVQPILDHQDHSLQMYSLPDLLVYGQGELNIRQFFKSRVASPGSFGERGLFQVYYPGSREMQESQVS